MNTAALKLFSGGRAREDLTVNAILPDPAGDQLAVLGSKVEDRTEFILIA